MKPRVLCLNAGSSSLKFALFEGSLQLLKGSVAGLPDAPRLLRDDARGAVEPALLQGPMEAHAAADVVLACLADEGLLDTLDAVAHRIVHGGERFTGATRLDAAVLDALQALAPLAPLHQPASLDIARTTAARLPRVAQVGAFDTAFHATRPRLDRLYALPRALTRSGVIGYGFHGLSYAHIARELRRIDQARAGGRAVVAHLGSGASLCAMHEGRSVATTMGFSALDGLPMATRCGAIDPGVLLHLMQARGFDAGALARLLHRESGLLGVSGLSGDMRVLLASDDPAAREAVDLFVYRSGQAIAAMAAALGGLDTLVFTAGVGEHAPAIRERIGIASAWMGVAIDGERNARGDALISSPRSAVGVRVIAADEEREMALETRALLSGPGA